MDNINGALAFDATIQNANFKREVDEMEAKIKGMTGTVAGEGRKMDNTFRNLAAGAAGVFTIQAAMQFRQKLIEVRGEFQKYQAVLANSLGSQKAAAESMKMLTDFASKTPFQLDALTSAYVKLVNQGFKPSIEQMRSLGDLASSTGKEFEQLAEAILDAQTGEFERLKEFGVKAAVSGDKISFAFKGVKTSVDNSAEAIRNYILSLGQMQGVKGAMAAISGTLVGQVSNLQDSITSMFNEIGQKSEGFLSKSIQSTAWLVENYEKIGKAVGALIITYGAYKTAVIVHSAVMTAAANASKGLTVAMQMQMRAELALIRVQALLNKTMLANPWVALATIIIGAVAAMALFMDKTTAAERAQKDFNDRIDELNGLQEENRAKNEELLSVITDVARADLERVVALGELQKKYPEIFAQYDIETIKLADILKLKRLIAEEDSKEAVATNENELAKAQAEVTRLQILYDEAQAATRNITTTPAGVVLTQTFDVAGLKTQLDEARKYLSEWEGKVQADRNNIVLANLKEYTTEQIQQEYAQRKAALEQMAKLDVQDITVSGGILEGKFDVDELKRQTAALETELNKRNAKVYDYTELQKYYADQLIEKQEELDKVYASKDKMSPVDWNKKVGELKGAIKEIEKAQTLLSEKTGKVTTDVDKQSFDDLLNYKKQKYDEYYTWLDAFGKDSANKEYANLIAEGETYSDYLQRQIATLEASRWDLNTKELDDLHVLQVALAEQVNAEKAAADEKARIQAEAEKQVLESLVSDYGGVVTEKLGFDKTYLNNKKTLTIAAANAASDEERKIYEDSLKGLDDERLRLEKAVANELQKEVLKELGLLDVYAGEGTDYIKDKITAVIPAFENLAEMTFNELKRAKEVIKDIELTPEQFDALEKAGVDVEKLKKALEELKKASSDAIDETEWEKLSDILDGLASGLYALGSALQKSGGALGEIGEGLSGISEGIHLMTVALDKNATTGDIINAGLQGVASLYSMIASQQEENRQKQEEWNAAIMESAHQMALLRIEAYSYKPSNIFGVENPYERAIDGALEYAQAMTELTDMADELADSLVQVGEKEVLDAGNIITGIGTGAGIGAAVGSIVPVIGTFIGAAIGAIFGGFAGAVATKTVPIFETLKEKYGEIYDKETFELNPQILADYDKLDDATKKLVDNWEEIRTKALEAQEQMREAFAALAGDIGDTLSDALVKAFRNGDIYDAIDDFHDAVTKTIEDIIAKLIFAAIFQKYFDQLGKDFEASFAEGGDMSIVDDILQFVDKWKEGIALYNQAMLDQQEAMKEAGFDIFQPETSGESMTGAIKGVSEETASLIAGQMNAIRMNQAASMDLVRGSMLTLQGLISQVSDDDSMLVAEDITGMRMNQTMSLDIMRNQLIALSGIKENTDVLPDSLLQLKIIAEKVSGTSGGVLQGTGIKI